MLEPRAHDRDWGIEQAFEAVLIAGAQERVADLRIDLVGGRRGQLRGVNHHLNAIRRQPRCAGDVIDMRGLEVPDRDLAKIEHRLRGPGHQ